MTIGVDTVSGRYFATPQGRFGRVGRRMPSAPVFELEEYRADGSRTERLFIGVNELSGCLFFDTESAARRATRSYEALHEGTRFDLPTIVRGTD